MPKNLQVEDIRPSGSVKDIKSSFGVALDVKSKNLKPFSEEVIFTDTRTLSAGQPIGLLLSLTYPTDTSFQVTRL